MSACSQIKYDQSMCELIKDGFAQGLSITQVCSWKLKVARSQYYEWKDKYPEFKRAAEEGEEASEAYHEEKLAEGADGKIENFSAPARIFLMKSRFRRTYGEEKEDKEKDAATTLLEQLVLGKVKIVSNE